MLAIVDENAHMMDARMAEGPYTLAKMHPAMDRIQVEPAELEGYVQYPGSDCRNGALLKVRDGHALMKNWSSHHNCLVGGNRLVEIDIAARAVGILHGKDRMMKSEEVLAALKKHVVIPVIAIESADDALPLADALIEGGLPMAEITFRTAAAAAVISRIAKERPQLVIGAGTILTKDNLAAAIDAGARFGVAPGLNPDILAEAIRRGLPFVPGVVTPSEVEQALGLGATLLKFFPAEASGGVADDQGPCRPLWAHGCEVRAHGRGERR